MKQFSIIILMSLITLLGGVGDVWAQTASGDWSAMTITGNKTVDLTGNVNIKGIVTIPAGASLTINGNNKTIFVAKGGSGKVGDQAAIAGSISFNVTGGTLTMNNVKLQGGFDGSFTPGNIGNGAESVFPVANAYGKDTSNDSKSSRSIVISGNGSQVNLNNVNVSKLYNHNNGVGENGCFIHATNTNTVAGGARNKINLTDVIVENCLSPNNSMFLVSGAGALYDVYMQRTTFKNCMVTNSYAGVVKGSGKTDCDLTMVDCTMENCWGSGWGGAILWASNSGDCSATLKNSTFKNNYARYLGGAISTEAVINLEDCNLINNTAGYGGGAIAAFPFTLADDTEGSNKQAVGLNLKSGNIIIGNKTLYVTNKGCATSGNPMYDIYKDAIYKTSGNVQTIENEIDTGFNPRYTINGATDVYYPSGGGAIWILMNKDNWNCSIDIAASNYIGQNSENGGNTSAYDGGGIFIYKQRPYKIVQETSGTTTVNKVQFQNDYTNNSGVTSLSLSADIYKNIAEHSGGGVAVGADASLSKFPDVTVNSGTIGYNVAKTGNGGGVSMPGGIFTMKGGAVKENIAQASNPSADAGNGGGISVANGTFSITSNSSMISGNKSSRNGGGLYVYNSSNTERSVSFSGGTFENNEAKAGGGVAVEGKIALTIENTDFQGNSAENGGGVYMNNGAKMSYISGLIRSNTAKSSGPDTGATGGREADTGYQLSATEINGFGGGVFMDSNTTLTFGQAGSAQKLGLYGNSAYNGADDIFANGNNTSVQLPNVTEMELSDFRVPVEKGNLYWVKDYVTNDNQYAKTPVGTDGVKDEVIGSTNTRYRYALSNLKENYYKLDDATYNEYISVALGYEIIYITIKKSGMQDDDSAIFKISKVADDATETPYISLVISSKNTTIQNGALVKKIALPAGTWTISEDTNWSWAYSTSTSSYTREITQSTSDNDRIFEFTNTLKSDTPKLRDETIIVNTFKVSSN